MSSTVVSSSSKYANHVAAAVVAAGWPGGKCPGGNCPGVNNTGAARCAHARRWWAALTGGRREVSRQRRHTGGDISISPPISPPTLLVWIVSGKTHSCLESSLWMNVSWMSWDGCLDSWLASMDRTKDSTTEQNVGRSGSEWEGGEKAARS